nr:hypothetical protein [uncultured Desulfobacter sp.]
MLIACLVLLVLIAYTLVQIHHYSATGFTEGLAATCDLGLLKQRVGHLILSGIILSSFGRVF